ncbi:UbiA family prenyltransferase [Methanogenium organophilum]|uniref:UbiA family prenyltransferase n=1 Tax=Methanogenium organophilum TaxID=2199 RepID=A0A9X9S404_METOG|nr:UbiA family prenyltransferase [Methanogenium organophilum]WAI01078.1 UbiA family prenyltransferase [Methanogenium organophilum]
MFKFEHTPGNSELNLQSLFDTILYSSLYLCIAAVSMVYLSSVLQDIPVSPASCVIMFLVTFSVYNLNRKTDEDEDAINHSKRYAFTKKHINSLMYLSLAAYVVAFLIAGMYGIMAAVITAIPLVNGILYSIPFLPDRFRYRRLKDIPFVKNFIVGLAWALPVALLPVACAGIPLGEMTIAMGLFFFLLSFIDSTVFDIRDVRGDAETGVQTIPVILGIPWTRILLSVMNAMGIGIILVLCNGYLSIVETAIIAGIAIYVQSYIILFNGAELSRVLYDLIADGQYLLLGGVMYISTVCIA